LKLLADENIPSSVCARLVREGFDIVSVAETHCGAKDEEVIRKAKEEERILLTFDKDFSELVFKEKISSKGVILLRFPPKSADFIFEKLKDLFSRKEIEFENNFLVVEEDRVRIRKIEF
jgi:predicted nuclease of predicted toxin-antitoxin system